uniref:ribosomal protein L27 n=1 Tax=Neustupella aerophytica TaxID=2962111 RepID=UPI002182275D|nr:ribosomal protein L27 [Neustupella aerophytica]UVI61111.1 ribosomal protein L27 [Neustupella aerophytica]
MAHKKGAGSTKNGRDSNAKRLGVKVVGGQFVQTGQIIIRQRGSAFKAGDNVGIGKDYTLYALKDGYVVYSDRKFSKKRVSVHLQSWEKLVTRIGYSGWSSFVKNV